ncbi:hypothetical protein VdG2_05358 [Verticillium dahliae VDG2]|nr:hypothetical protein VdG2_05358 [Verticillium dahliae VDG2]
MSNSITLVSSKAQFDKLVKETPYVVVDFYADWCGPCKQIAPLFQQLSETAAEIESVKFLKVDTEANSDVAAAHQVTALPTFMVFKNGKVLEKIQGADPRKLQSVIEPKGCELLNADDDAGSVRVLFDGSKPSALDKKEGVKDWVESGEDDQLLLFMPFQAMLKLHTLHITSLPPSDDDDEDAPMRPRTIHLYTNKPHNLDFAEADDTPPTQVIELSEKDWNASGTANVSLRYVKFQNITSLVLYVVNGDGDGDKVRLDRVRLVGDSGEKREMGKLEKIGDEPGE